MKEHQRTETPRLDNLAFVTTFPKDYLPYAQQKRKSDPMESNPHWKYKRKRWWPFRRCCNLSSATTIISITVTILAFMAALGVSIYFGVLTSIYTSPVFHIYGKIRVTEGDEFDSSLLDANSANFASKAAIYENKLRSTYLRSLFQYVLHEVRIYGFRGPGLNIFFRLHLDRRKGTQIQGINNLARTVLLNEIHNGEIFEGLKIDPESVSFSSISCLDDCPTQAPTNTTTPLLVSDWFNTIDVTTKKNEQDEAHFKRLNVTNNNETIVQLVTPVNTKISNVTILQIDANSTLLPWKNVSEWDNTTVSAKYNDTGVTISSPKFVSQFTNREENALVHQENDKQNRNLSAIEDDLIVPVNETALSSTTELWNEFDVVNIKAGKNKIPECGKEGFRCADNKCIPGYRKCDRFTDCSDNSDEANCTCSDYLITLEQPRKICDGFIDCWDYSDESQCPWCSDDMFHCPGAKVCIKKTKVCDGIRDCPSGSDEATCMKIAKDVSGANGFAFANEGYLMIQREGQWKKLCLDNNNLIDKPRWNVEKLGYTVCSSLTYKTLESIVLSPRKHQEDSYYELIPATERSGTKFLISDCADGKIARIRCRDLACGLGSPVQLPTKRIVGGDSVPMGARPWLAALYREGQFQCGAIVIADRWLLSAGHCFFHTKHSYWVARMGLLRRGTDMPTPYEVLKRIIQIKVNPQYINKNFINDIAVLKLESAVPFSNYIRPICLPQPEDDVVKWNGKKCSVVGWGKLGENGDEFPDTLQEVQLPVISTEECRKRTLFLSIYQITDNMFCAGYERGGRDACLGDSGGPMMCQKEDGRWVLIGIISNGDGCARPSRPGVYTKVGNFMNWIDSIMNENATDEVKPDSCLGTRCKLGMCLFPESNCDGNADCPDGSDEEGC